VVREVVVLAFGPLGKPHRDLFEIIHPRARQETPPPQ
jgi:hypothetical protein